MALLENKTVEAKTQTLAINGKIARPYLFSLLVLFTCVLGGECDQMSYATQLRTEKKSLGFLVPSISRSVSSIDLHSFVVLGI